MYIRYALPPSDFFDWYEDYLQDEEEVDAKAGGGTSITIGQMCRQFLTKLEWFSTLFPRIPVPVQKQIDQQLAEYDRKHGIVEKPVRDFANANTARPERSNNERYAREQQQHQQRDNPDRRDKSHREERRRSRSRSREKKARYEDDYSSKHSGR